MNNLNKVYTTEEIAQILKVHPLTAAKYVREGKIQGFRLTKRWRVSENALEEFISKKELVR